MHFSHTISKFVWSILRNDLPWLTHTAYFINSNLWWWAASYGMLLGVIFSSFSSNFILGSDDSWISIFSGSWGDWRNSFRSIISLGGNLSVFSIYFGVSLSCDELLSSWVIICCTVIRVFLFCTTFLDFSNFPECSIS